MERRRTPPSCASRRPTELNACFDFCQENGIEIIIGVEPDKTEDITDIERALSARTPARATSKTGRNEKCPGGSGKKFKKCCEVAPAALPT